MIRTPELPKNLFITIRKIAFFLMFCYGIPVVAADTGIIQPLYVKPITHAYQQYNDIKPGWSGDAEFINFEHFDNFSHGIVITDREGKVMQSVYAQRQQRVYTTPALSFGNNKSIWVNSALSWAPGNSEFAFSSNGNTDNFDIYIGNTYNWKTRRITFHPEKDSYPQWSPSGKYISFISARDKYAKLFLYDIRISEAQPLLQHPLNIIYSRWSPDGKKIAIMMGESNLYQLYIIEDIEHPNESLRQLTQLISGIVRPTWSPDGSKLAFYINRELYSGDINWQIAVIETDSSGVLDDSNLENNLIADQVVPNVENGPAWLNDGVHLTYIKSSSDQYNPIYIVNIATRKESLVQTHTYMNKDVNSSSDGTLVFQTQDKQWSRIYIAKLPVNEE